jgi:hypothetical protein
MEKVMQYKILSKSKISILLIILLLVLSNSIFSQEQSRASAAVDPTAAQWSFQLAYEGNYDYRNVETNGAGNKGFLQFRLVAPIGATESFPITLLPRLTVRLVQNQEDNYGFGQSDLFILGIAQQWSSGRWGFGPQINFPSAEGFGNTNWGYGLAAALTQRAFDDDLFLSLLLQQVWRDDGTGVTRAAPLGINAAFVYQLGKGFYVGNGDFVISYNWQDQSWFVPFGVRFGRAFIGPESTWNAYIEYRTWASDEDWSAPVADHNLRINVQYQIPVSF